MSKHLIFDTETTDLWNTTVASLDNQPEIFDWYGLTFDTHTLEQVDELQVFAKPYRSIAAGAAKATKKNDSFFQNFDRFSKNAEAVKFYIESHDCVVGHNVVFDIEVTNFEFKRLGLSVNWPRAIDTVEKTEWLKGYRLSLTDLHIELFGEKFEGAHEAKTDVVATMRCYRELIKRNWI